MKRIFVLLTALAIIFCSTTSIFAASAKKSEAELTVDSGVELDLDVKSAVLMEATTGTVLYSKNSTEALPPASVTKVMTLLLVAEALSENKITLSERVRISPTAASMGGSQVFLEEGEEMTVEELLKCTVIASANDAAVALAELLCGSESAFVALMNERAGELGMKNTYFENATGLDESTSRHLTSAEDIAIMSRELIKHECVTKYSSVWQDSIRGGEFVLTNTNRLVRYYSGCTGLKTGSTDKAGFCVSATAKRGNMELIAVVMGSPTREVRNDAARTLLDFGFASYSIYNDPAGALETVPVYFGTRNEVIIYSEGFSALCKKGEVGRVEKNYVIPESLRAPIAPGDTVGEIIYTLGGEELGRAALTVTESVPKITIGELFLRIVSHIIIGR